MNNVFKFIVCKLLKIHKFENQMCNALYNEGWDEFYICKYCNAIKKKYIDKDWVVSE